MNGSRRMSASTQAAARAFTRRSLLRSAAAGGGALAAGPWLVERALASSGELNILHRGDEVRESVLPDFTAKTGIKVNTTAFSQNEEQIKKLQDAAGPGFDLCQPAGELAPRFQALGVLQPLEPEKLANLKSLIPAIADGA